LLSAVSGLNVRTALFRIGAEIRQSKEREEAEARPAAPWQP